MSDELDLLRTIRAFEREIERLKVFDVVRPYKALITPLTAGAWEGGTHSTTAKTVIDLSAVFGVPAGVRSVNVQLFIKDSGSAAGSAYINLGPNNVANNGLEFSCSGIANNTYNRGVLPFVPCDSNGDIYYQIVATGALSMTVWLRILGYSRD